MRLIRPAQWSLLPPAQWFLLPRAHPQPRAQIRKEPSALFRRAILPLVPSLSPAPNSTPCTTAPRCITFLCATVPVTGFDSMAGKSMVDPRCTGSQAGSGHHLCAAVVRASEPAHPHRRAGPILPSLPRLPERREPPSVGGGAPSSPRRALATKAECSLPLPQAARHANTLCNPLASRPLEPPTLLSASFPPRALGSEGGLRGQGMCVGALGGAVAGNPQWEHASGAAEEGAGERGNQPVNGIGVGVGLSNRAAGVGEDPAGGTGRPALPSSLCGKKRKKSGSRSEPPPALGARGGEACHQPGPARGEVTAMVAEGRATESVGVTGASTVFPREGKALPARDRPSGEAELTRGDAVPLSHRPSGDAAPPSERVPQPSADGHSGGGPTEVVETAATQGACHQQNQGQDNLGAERAHSGGETDNKSEGGVPGREEAGPDEGGSECGASAAQSSGEVVRSKEEEGSRDGGGAVFETTFQLAPCLGSGGSGAKHRARADMSLVVLNFDLPPFTHILWEQAGALRVCADGGANRLYDGVPLAFPQEDPEAVRDRFIPDVIKGDLDSIRPEVLAFYESKGTRIFNLSEDQDTTDLHKCIQHIADHHRGQRSKGGPGPGPGGGGGGGEEGGVGVRTCLETDGHAASPAQMEILVVGGLGGRVDHEFGNINVLHRFQDLRIVLLSSYCLLTLLPARQRLVIRPNLLFEGPHCGLIPVYQASAGTTTTGLRWNLRNLAMSFGALVSTSNQLAGGEVTVESDVPLLWTTELRLP